MVKVCIRCGLAGEFYAKPRTVCKECIKNRAAQWYANNKSRALANVARYRIDHKEESNALKKAWAVKNKHAASVTRKKYAEKYPERRKASKLSWYLKNPERYTEYASQRRATKLNSTPAWANKFFMQEIYSLARLRTKVMGFKWHVDHIVPLKSDVVCGLHCEQNLQVIPASSNLAKHNRVWPDK